MKETKLKHGCNVFWVLGIHTCKHILRISQGLWTLFRTLIGNASTAFANFEYQHAKFSSRETLFPVAYFGEIVNQGVLPGPDPSVAHDPS